MLEPKSTKVGYHVGNAIAAGKGSILSTAKNQVGSAIFTPTTEEGRNWSHREQSKPAEQKKI